MSPIPSVRPPGRFTRHGYPVLRDIREVSTTSALLRDGEANAVALPELRIRLRSIRNGDDQHWLPF